MKKILLLIFVLCFSLNYAQTTLFVEDFNYAAGDVLTAHNWLQSGTTATNPITVTTPGLTFTNYPTTAGNACTLTTSGQDVYQTFTPVSSGSIYLAFLINVQSAQTGLSSDKADYFITFSPSVNQTYYTARVALKANGNGFSIGVSKSSELSAVFPFGSTVFNFNQTYLIVVKHTFNITSTTDDAISVYVLSSLSLSTTEPTTPTVGPYVCLDATKTDQADLAMVTIRQGSSGSAPTLIIDGIRVATNWGLAVTGTATDVEENNSVLPTKFDLSQNYPNPFNPSTTIKYQVPQNSFVSVNVYDVLGNEVRTLVREEKAAGSYELRFDAGNMPSGVYFYKIQAGNFTQTKKMILMK